MIATVPALSSPFFFKKTRKKISKNLIEERKER